MPRRPRIARVPWPSASRCGDTLQVCSAWKRLTLAGGGAPVMSVLSNGDLPNPGRFLNMAGALVRQAGVLVVSLVKGVRNYLGRGGRRVSDLLFFFQAPHV